MKLNSELRAEARETLSGNWGTGALIALLYYLIGFACAFAPFVGGMASLVVGPILAWGFCISFLQLKRQKTVNIVSLFDGFYDFGRTWCTMILMGLFIFLWCLLLIVPGIIKSYSYAMTPYLLKDRPDLQNNAAIEKSMAMMEGKKMKLFLLDLSFIGWIILASLTIFGLFFLVPYMQAAHAAFYEDLRTECDALDMKEFDDVPPSFPSDGKTVMGTLEGSAQETASTTAADAAETASDDVTDETASDEITDFGKKLTD